MKNILTYISPDKKFNDEHQRLAKIQIDNSLSLGWKKEDIILATNFEYEHNGIKSMIVSDENYCTFSFPVTKLFTIINLFKTNVIKNNELYWYHDFDCFELNNIKEDEVKMELGTCNLGVSNYSQRPRLCSASMFFYKTAEDIFDWMKKEAIKSKVNEEHCLMRAYYNIENNLSSRIKMINTTYAFHRFNIRKTYRTTIKPIRAAHFHITPDKYDFFVKGNNKLNIVIIPERLIKIFDTYGFNDKQ